MPDTPSPSSRKRGGQPGNLNAATHGLYSRLLTPARLIQGKPWVRNPTLPLDQVQIADLDQQIELLRASIRRLIEMHSQPPTLAEAADQLRTICLALEALTRFVRDQYLSLNHKIDLADHLAGHLPARQK